METESTNATETTRVTDKLFSLRKDYKKTLVALIKHSPICCLPPHAGRRKKQTPVGLKIQMKCSAGLGVNTVLYNPNEKAGPGERGYLLNLHSNMAKFSVQTTSLTDYSMNDAMVHFTSVCALLAGLTNVDSQS